MFVYLVFFPQTGQHCSLIPLTADMLEEDNDEICWNNLENFRVKLISVIDPSRITPYLRQCKVLSPDDEEQVLNDPSLVMRKRKAGGSTSNTFVEFPGHCFGIVWGGRHWKDCPGRCWCHPPWRYLKNVALSAMVWFSYRMDSMIPDVFSNLIYFVIGSQGFLYMEKVQPFFLLLQTGKERNN